jgi:predicted ribosome quality control (RQC) complex YloA/Tae2 family protein
MIFDSLVLAAVTEELTRTVVGGKVERITQPSALELVLALYHQGTKYALLLSADSQEARVHLTTRHYDTPMKPPAFCMLLRKHLAGAWLTEATQPRGFAERVLRLEFRTYDGARMALIAETMGRHSNLVFVNDAGTVLGCAKVVTHAINRVRETRPGLAYIPPPRQRGRVDPMSHFDFATVSPPTPGEEADWLTTTFSGVSPLLAREATLRAKSPWTAETLWYGLNEILTVVRLGEYSPHLWTDENDHILGAYPIPLLSVPADAQHPRETLSAALDEAAVSQERRDTFTQTRDALRTVLHRAIQAREQERIEIEKGLANADRAEEYQHNGELLLAHPALTAPGTTQTLLPDYYAPLAPNGSPPLRAVSLDPALDLRANAERYFKKARKARDGRERFQQRLTELSKEMILLGQAEKEVPAATIVSEITAIRERVAESLPAMQPTTNAEKETRQEPEFAGYKIKRTHSPDGWEMLVGENATSNDYLTTKLAAPSDIWFHVRAATSAHGIIRTGNRPASVSPAALQQAAAMVAARSEVKHSSLIPVDYTLKKYVRKPRKSAPGAVTYQNEKTLYVSGIE